VQIDGEWILPDYELDRIFQKIRSQGLLKTTFWEERVQYYLQFEGMMKSPNNHPVLFYDGRVCVGLAWLSGVSGNFAFTHYCLFREVWGKRTLEIGQKALDYWFSWPGEDGPLLDVLIGILPGFNKRAHRFADRLGWKRLGEIPRMFKDRQGDRDHAVVYFKER
jgi:RimJ/RimL family protein N-acetyltransferase